MSVILKNVELFEDRHFEKSWSVKNTFDVNGFKVEFKDGKARVYSNAQFSTRERSRYAKLNRCGQWTGGGKDVHGFVLRVEGNDVYFRVDIMKHKIF